MPAPSQILMRTRPAHTKDVLQANHNVLVCRYVNSCNTGHLSRSSRPCEAGQYIKNQYLNLSLPLLVAGVRTDHPDHTIAANDLAVPADLLNRCTDFHRLSPSLCGGLSDQAALRRPISRSHGGWISSSGLRTDWTSCMRLQLGHEVHHNDDNDQQRGTAEVERHLPVKDHANSGSRQTDAT